MFVPLTVLCCKFIHPAQFGLAFFASYISNNVPTSEHHPILSFAKKSTKSHDGYNYFPYYFKARISEEMDETVTQLTMSVFVGRTQNNLIITLPVVKLKSIQSTLYYVLFGALNIRSKNR